MAEKIDLQKLHKEEYATPRKPALIETKPAQYLAIEGKGAPGGERFVACVEALYGMAFTIKMTRKFAGLQDYAVCKLECRYPRPDSCKLPREEWVWQLLIRTPDFVTEADRQKAMEAQLKKGKARTVTEVNLTTIDEGRCVQMLHVGPYDKEGETLALMQEYAEGKKLKPRGAVHEIYLSDPRRVAAERLKTILRVPVTKGE